MINQLGFDACCSCAKPLQLSDKVDICCKTCRRVWYCSRECQQKDACNYGRYKINNSCDEQEEQEGHSPVVCALLRICYIDDQVEGSLDPDAKKIPMSKKEREASKDRITSEYESYPATLTNILMEVSCFEFFLNRMKKQKVDRSIGRAPILAKTSLTIHIIGASEEAEFWGDYKLDHPSCRDVYPAYAEALTDLVAMYNGITTIHLIFIGPNCPVKNLTKRRSIQLDQGIKEKQGDARKSGSKKRKQNSNPTCEVVLQSYRSEYVESLTNIPKPDVCVFYNPGFTCPDYDWSQTLDKFVERDDATRIPFFATTNTEMEAISDLQFLYNGRYIDGLPATLREIDDALSDGDRSSVGHSEAAGNTFFGENPSSGTRVRQSGNMANDLFVKNRWVYGGIFGCGDGSNEEIKAQNISKPKSTTKSVSNSRSNPALL
jgi:hypothetical protein